jgi:hypothetical protein
MVAKKKRASTGARGKSEGSKLKLNKDTVKDLADNEAEKIRGGLGPTKTTNCPPPTGPSARYAC